MFVRQVVDNDRHSLAYAARTPEKQNFPPTKNYVCQVCNFMAVQLCHKLKYHNNFSENMFQNKREGDVTTKLKVGRNVRHLLSCITRF